MNEPIVTANVPDWALKLQIDNAVHKEKLESIDKKIERLFLDLETRYARKEQMEAVEARSIERGADLDKKITKLNDYVGWVVKAIVGAFLAGLIGIVFAKAGVPRL